MEHLLECKNVKLVTAPVDLNTAAVTGDRVDLKGNKKVAFVISMGTSTGATVQFDLKQHNAASSGTSKALSIANVYYKKAGAATSFTKVEPTVEASSYDLSTDFAANGGVVIFEVNEDQLDTNNGFGWVSVDIADSGAAKLGSVIAITDSDLEPAYGLAI